MMARAPADAVFYAVGDIHGRIDLLARLHDDIVTDTKRRKARLKFPV
jgi:hypothetical protein